MDMCRLHHDYCLMNGGGDAADRELAAVAAAAGRHLLDLSHDIWLLLTGDIPELRGDDIVEKLLDASVQENVATLLHVFEHGLVPDDLPAPAAAVEYARRLAQRGVPIVALVVLPRQVGQSADGWVSADGGVGPVMVVLV